MPIGIDRFESDDDLNERSVPERVVRFLAANDDKAYRRDEIAAAIDADPDVVSTALSRLSTRELVRHRGNYWAITTDRERLRAAYDLHAATNALDTDDGGIDPTAWDEEAPAGAQVQEESSDHSP